MIPWAILRPALELTGIGWLHRAEVEQSLAQTSPKQIAGLLTLIVLGGGFYLAFFSVHFAAFAQRTFNLLKPVALPSAATAVERAIAARAPSNEGSGRLVTAPYFQVARMHIVIIVLGGVRALHRESFVADTLI